MNIDWDLVLDVAMILTLLIAGLYYSSARSTLEHEGCEAYWNQYNGGYEGMLVNKSEAELYKRGGAPIKNESVNLSNYAEKYE